MAEMTLRAKFKKAVVFNQGNRRELFFSFFELRLNEN